MQSAKSTDVTFRTKLVGWILFNGLFLITITVNLILLLGLFYCPFQVGIYILLPYYTYNKIVTKPEVKQGGRWVEFSKRFFLFQQERTFLSMNISKPVPSKLIEMEKKKNAQFIIAMFPHGTAADFRIGMDGILDEVFPNIYSEIRTLGASVLFLIPIVREFCVWTSGIDASRPVAEKALDKGCSLLILPGGEAEQIRTVYQNETVYLKRRRGFIKLALKKGIPTIPSYVFGVSDYYVTNNLWINPRLWLVKNLGICIPFAIGLWGSIFCPYPVKTTIVFGEPMTFQVKDPNNPTSDELENAHESFCNELTDLFNQHKGPLGYGERTLEII